MLIFATLSSKKVKNLLANASCGKSGKGLSICLRPMSENVILYISLLVVMLELMMSEKYRDLDVLINLV